MCQDKKQPHKCCGNCKKNFDKAAPKDTPKTDGVPPKRTCGTKPPANK